MAYVVIRDPRSATHVHPTFVHEGRPEAEKEAGRLAIQDRGVLFFVCKLVSEVSLPKEEACVTRYDDGSGHTDPWEIPF